MAPVLHILDIKSHKSICGVIGGTTYNPVKANCSDCLKYFKQLYPGSYEAWVAKEKKQ